MGRIFRLRRCRLRRSPNRSKHDLRCSTNWCCLGQTRRECLFYFRVAIFLKYHSIVTSQILNGSTQEPSKSSVMSKCALISAKPSSARVFKPCQSPLQQLITSLIHHQLNIGGCMHNGESIHPIGTGLILNSQVIIFLEESLFFRIWDFVNGKTSLRW